MPDYIILDEPNKEKLEETVNKLLSNEWFDLKGGVVVYVDERNHIHFLQTLYKGS